MNPSPTQVFLKALIEIRNWCQVEGCAEQVAIADKAMTAAGLKDIPCFQCDGLGEWDEGPLPARSSAQISPEYRQVKCPECNGSGRLNLAASPQPHRAGDPFIEFGNGWAKIHFRRDVTEQDRANLTASLALTSKEP